MNFTKLLIFYVLVGFILQGYSQDAVDKLTIAPSLTSDYDLKRIESERNQLNLEISHLQESLKIDPSNDNSKLKIEELFFKKQLLLEIEVLIKDRELKAEQDKTKRITIISVSLGILSLLLFVLGTIVLLLFRERTKRKAYKQEINRYKLITLNQQLNPHFIYNALTSVQHFVLTSDKMRANEYITDFAKLMRIILANSQKDLISIIDELEATKLYLKLESLRFNDQFNFQIDYEDEITYHKIPSFLLQPFIENALWHGLLHKQEPGIVKINLKMRGDTIFISIEDNGIGREESYKINSNKKSLKESYGIMLSQQRINLLNKESYRNEAKLRIIDLKEEDKAIGTRVEIELPVLN